MRMKINLNNVIKIDLSRDDQWGRITEMNSINGKMVFQFKLDGYTDVWLEKVNNNHRLIAYTKDGISRMVYKLSNNTSKSTQESIFKMCSYPVPSDDEYNSFLNRNKPKVFKGVKESKETSKSASKRSNKKVESLEELSIDSILDKISKKGLKSLTPKEKKFIDEESKKL